MNFVSLIELKRDGHELTPDQLKNAMSDYLHGRIPDYQMAAFLMAVYFQGLTWRECTALTLIMRDSGTLLRLPEDPRPIVDKHSTGGVGDKVSLPLVPLLAALGFRVPMISGRALGITGGTLDKLESIPGFQTELTTTQIVQTVQEVGCVVCSQTADMVPADKKLYALRDVTGTVPSIPLIVASIMSKKLAEQPHALILDVKFGRAAFMQTFDQARTLAEQMVRLGLDCGVNTRAIITNMNTPLGRAAGNWLEVVESDRLLRMTSPPPHSHPLHDVATLVLSCAGHLLVQTGRARDLTEAITIAQQCLCSGAAYQKWRHWLAAQGADLDAFDAKLAQDHTAPVVAELKSDRTGFVSHCDARTIGQIIRDLGGGRIDKNSLIDHNVGVDALAKPGEHVRAGDLLARIHAPDSTSAEYALRRLAKAITVADAPPPPEPLIAGTVTR